MELTILSKTKTSIGKIKLPKQFEEVLRPDIIKKAFLTLRSRKIQPYGADPRAGLRASADLSRRRKKYRGSYGHGISRVPRKILSRRGTRFNWVGAVAPGTVGGRKAHAPNAEKKWELKINKKEKKKAIRSALSATMIKELVEERGHIVPENYPFIIEKSIQNFDKTKQVKDFLIKIGLEKELERVNKKTIRAGKGKTRGRKYKKTRGILLVVSDDCKIERAARNIPGLEIAKIKEINVEILAPGANPGRLTLFTQDSIEKLGKENLFI